MKKTASVLAKNGSSNAAVAARPFAGQSVSESTQSEVAGFAQRGALPVEELQRYATDWYYDCQYRQHTARTVAEKKFILDKLFWFLNHKGHTHCGLVELRRFLTYVTNGHLEPGGRWGNPHMTTPVRPVRVRGYYSVLSAWYQWMVDEELIVASPMLKIARPMVRTEQIKPFTAEQIEAILRAARRSKHPRRDEAIVLFLLDTGIRAGELCALKMSDIDTAGRRCMVMGKGNKTRVMYFGRNAAKALWKYLQEVPREAHEPVFLSDRGLRAGEAFTPSGLFQLIERLGRAANIQATRCSPHTFRHTFAFLFTQNGGNAFTLKELLGHTSLAMTNRYVALASANMEAQHRQFSPGDRVGRK